MKKKRKVPKIYLDTVIIRILIEKEPAWLINLMRTIKERKWVCFSSTLAILELSDLRKDDIYLANKVKEKAEYKEIIRKRDQKELIHSDLIKVDRYVKGFLKKYPFFSAYQIPELVWKSAYTMTSNSNIHSIDAVHLATAVAFKADVLLTLDNHFIKEANKLLDRYGLSKKIKVISSQYLYSTLSELGFKLDK